MSLVLFTKYLIVKIRLIIADNQIYFILMIRAISQHVNSKTVIKRSFPCGTHSKARAENSLSPRKSLLLRVSLWRNMRAITLPTV